MKTKRPVGRPRKNKDGPAASVCVPATSAQLPSASTQLPASASELVVQSTPPVNTKRPVGRPRKNKDIPVAAVCVPATSVSIQLSSSASTQLSPIETSSIEPLKPAGKDMTGRSKFLLKNRSINTFFHIGTIHRKYTLAQKQKMSEYARVNGLRPAQRKFNVHRRSIARWMEFRLEEVKTGEISGYRRRGQGRKLSYPESIDEELVRWILELRDMQVAVSSDMLKQKATSLITPIVSTFKASSGWCEKFYRYITCVVCSFIKSPFFMHADVTR